MRGSALPVGSHAPAFVIRGKDGAALVVDSALRPRVLAFVRDWDVDAEAEHTAQLRAGLRGLGAEMTILADSGAWSVRADDPIERLACDPARLAGNIAATALLYGLVDRRDAVFVIDHHGVIAFSHAPSTSLAGALPTALVAAVDAMHTRPSPPLTFTRRQWATSCLVTGFVVALFGCHTAV